MSVTPTLTDIPFAVFLDALVPHLEVKEIGSLTLVSKDLQAVCDDNLVWREMYLRTIRCGISDSSVHTFSRNGCCAQPDLCSFTYSNPFGLRQDIAKIVNSDGYLYNRYLPCLPEAVRLEIPTIPSARVNLRYNHYGDNSEYSADRKVRLQLRAEYSEVIREIWQTHNKERGLSTVNLCQCASHYQFDTLDIPSSCKNCKSYKTNVLSKMRTQAKKPLAPLNTKLRQKQRDIKGTETRLRKLRIEEATLKASHAEKSRLSDRLNAAVTSMKDAVTKRNQQVKDDKKTARLAKAKAKKAKTKAKKKAAEKETTETE